MTDATSGYGGGRLRVRGVAWAVVVAMLVGGRPAHGGGVRVGRVDVEPSGGSTAEAPVARVVGETPGAGLAAASGNRGDWTLTMGAAGQAGAGGLPMRQVDGVIMTSLNELLPQTKRGGVEVAGALTVPQSNVKDGGSWVAGFTSEGDGGEANVDFAAAFFPFVDGWVGGHLAKDGATWLASGNLPAGSSASLVQAGSTKGEIQLRLGGVDALEDGMLFAVVAGNGDNVAAVGPLADGSGWNIRIADESGDWRKYEASPCSFVYLPYRLAGLTGGWIGEDGRVLAGTGSFGVRHTAPGRYEVVIPGRSGRDGVLLVVEAKMNPDGVEDNAVAWAYDPTADGGRGAFVVESYDQPDYVNQDTRFYVAFLEYENQLDPGNLRPEDRSPGVSYACAQTWAESVLGYRALLAAGAEPADRFRPYFSGVLGKAAPPRSVDLAVQGLSNVWLVVDPVDTNVGDVAAWGDAGFVLRDGSVRRLREMAPLFASVGSGRLETRPVQLGDRRVEDGLVVPAPSLLGYAVPADAVRLRALAGLDSAAGPTASVEFRVVDDHGRRPLWSAGVRPALQQRFPAVMGRLYESVEDARSPHFDLDASLPRLRDAVAVMVAELGSLAAGLPPAGEDLAATLRRFEAGCRWLDDIARIGDEVWAAAPALAQVMDYPAPALTRLRAKLELIRATQPGQAGPCGARLAQFDACEATRGEVIRQRLAGDRSALARLPELGRQLVGICEWADAARGWTTYRGDNERTAISREVLTWPLHAAWVHTPVAPPAPAWPPPRADNPAVNHRLSPTLTYDRAYHVVAADGRVFYGDNAADAVVCLDARTGAEAWRFTTEGPVRLAPALWSDRVYAVCDDGWLYCLKSASGEPLWRYRAGPDATRLPGNQRLVSQWPVRCGICVDRGTVYIGAGVFASTAGAFLCAVDAVTGQERWKQATGCVPQGFLVVSPTRLLVPTGRTPFHAFERQTGKPLNRFGQSNSWGRDLPGGTCALVVNRTVATGPGEGGVIHLFDEKASEAIFTTEGQQVIVDGLSAYVLMRTKVVGLRRRDYLSTAKPERLWEGACRSARTMIKVGEHLVIGGDEGVEVLSAADGRALGHVALEQAEIEGLAWHNGRLFASATDGRIVCLTGGPAAAGGPLTLQPARIEWRPPAATAAVAQDLLQTLGRSKGYALVVGADGVDLAVAVAAGSALQCVVADADAARCLELRNALTRSGLLGTRVSVHRLETGDLSYRPYLFNLVVATGAARVPPAELYRVLRPCGGVLAAATPAGLADCAGKPAGESLVLPPGSGFEYGFRRAALPGAGRWTHGYADAGNTLCSGDPLPFGAFDVLWFGRPGPQFMYERHVKGAPPLCADGLLFVTGCDYLAGVDAYNGTVLWEEHVQGSGRMAVLKDCGNMATADGLLYLAVGARCLVLDGLSGRTRSEFAVPRTHGEPVFWDYIAVAGDHLLGSGSRPESRMVPGVKADYQAVWFQNQPVVTSGQLFALRRQTGETAWTYEPAQGVIVNPTLTVLGGRVCFVESTNPETRRHPTGKIPLGELSPGGPQVVALDIATGAECWRTGLDLSAFHHSIYMAGKDGTLVLTGSRHDDVKGKRLIQYQLLGLDLGSGRELWRNDNTPSRAEILDGGHGEQTQHPVIVGDTVYGPGFARKLRDGAAHDGWKWNKSPNCAPMSASQHCAFSRQGGFPTVAEFATGKESRLTQVSRPGCWINTLPAGGVVAIPEASSGCTCPYPVQASLALCPRLPAAGR